MFEIRERTTVTVDGETVEIPVGRIRDEDARRYGLLGAAPEVAVEAPEPEAVEDEPVKAKRGRKAT